MSKKLTTTDFIIRARTTHGNKYDYSKSNYTSKDEKLIIICPEHGEFLQSPNNHWKGKGCPSCGKNKKLTIFEFIERSALLHNNHYDYSRVVFDNARSKITIICPEHGEFIQTVEKHLAGQGCRECAKLKRAATCIEKYGVDHPMKSQEIKEKLNTTMIENYGVDNYFKTDEGRSVVKEYHISHSDELKAKREATMVERYGVKNALQSKIFVDKMKNTNISRYGVPSYFQTDAAINAGAEYRKTHWAEMLEKQKQTNVEQYGVECVFSSNEIREKIKITNIERYGSEYPTKTDIVKERTVATNLERYGVSYPMQSDEIKEKAVATNIERYGAKHIVQSKIMQSKMLDEYGVPFFMQSEYFKQKSIESKRENGTFNTSKPEEYLYQILCDKFGENDVHRQYRDNR
jgi:hypothetical protein